MLCVRRLLEKDLKLKPHLIWMQTISLWTCWEGKALSWLFFASNVHLKCVTFLAIKERLTNQWSCSSQVTQWSCTGASETYVTPEGSKKCKLEKPDIKVKKADLEAGETFVKGWKFWRWGWEIHYRTDLSEVKIIVVLPSNCCYVDFSAIP
jgi:hypothetical protein